MPPGWRCSQADPVPARGYALGVRPPSAVRDLLPQDEVEAVMATATFVNTVGNGLFSVTSALFFTRIVGIPPLRLGFAFSVAAFVGLVTTLPMGQLADRVSPKALNVRLALVSAAGMFLYALATTYAWFFVVAMVLAVSDQGGRAARNTLIARIGGSSNKVRIRAYLRSVTNLGIAIGTLGGGLALAVDNAAFYRALITVNAASTLLSAVLLRRLPELPVLRSAERPRRTEALRDHTYVVLTVVNMLMSMHFMLLELIVPLWIAHHTTAPRWIAAGTYLVNTIACVLFQVRMSQGADDLRIAARLQRSGGMWLAIGTVVYASAAWFGSPWIAGAVMLLAAAVHVAGELRQSSGSFGIGFNLPPEHLQGQYQAVWSLGYTVAAIVAPTWLTWLAFSLGTTGWVILGAQFALAGMLSPWLVERALRDPRRQAVA